MLARPNRYLAVLQFGSSRQAPSVSAHIPNPGRMEELLVPGKTWGYAVPVVRPHRRTAYDFVSVYHDGTLVSIDSRVANPLVGAALRAGSLTGWPVDGWAGEPRWGHGRLDFARRRGSQRRPDALLEVKSSNLKVGDTALFPDAPTARGTRHLVALRDASRKGIRAGVVFIVQRDDVVRFQPNRCLDPEFARAVGAAARGGVRVQAFSVHVRPDRVVWGVELPVELGSGVPSGETELI